MARSQARIHTSVWRNADFTQLPRSTQGLYWMLLSQPDVSLAGVVPLVERRWRKLSTDKPDDLDTDLDLLAEHGFVVVDEDCGEVWIRSFVKHDGVLASEKTRAGMWSAYKGIMSCRIRLAFLAGIGAEKTLEARERDWVSQADLEVENTPSNTPSDTPSPRARADSDSTSDSYSDKGGDAGASPPDPIELRFERWWQSYPRHAKNGKPGGGGSRKTAASAFRRLSEAKRKLAEQSLPHYRAWVESPDGEYPTHASTWLNEERWEQWLEPAHRQERGQTYGETLPDGTRRGVM